MKFKKSKTFKNIRLSYKDKYLIAKKTIYFKKFARITNIIFMITFVNFG